MFVLQYLLEGDSERPVMKYQEAHPEMTDSHMRKAIAFRPGNFLISNSLRVATTVTLPLGFTFVRSLFIRCEVLIIRLQILPLPSEFECADGEVPGG